MQHTMGYQKTKLTRTSSCLFLCVLALIFTVQEAQGQICLSPPRFNCTPGIPQIPLPLSRTFVIPTQLAGTWYEYMIYNPLFSYTNLVTYFTPLGNVLSAIFAGTDTNPNNALSGIFMNITVAMYKLPEKNCTGNFLASFVANDGRIQNLALLPASGLVRPVFLYYDILFTDYTNVTIYSFCASMNIAANLCTKATISVLIRTPPSRQTQAAKDYVKSVVDSTLNPYCLSSVNLQLSNWNDYLPVCSPTPPDQFVTFTQLLAQFNA